MNNISGVQRRGNLKNLITGSL